MLPTNAILNPRHKTEPTLSDNDMISAYFGVCELVDWKVNNQRLCAMLMTSGHSVDLMESDGDMVRVATGKAGVNVCGLGRSPGEALVNALVAYIRFAKEARLNVLDGRIQTPRSAMPFHTALEWIDKGQHVRRVIWPAGATLRLEKGSLNLPLHRVAELVCGVPSGYYEQREYAEKKDPVFMFSSTENVEFLWVFDALSVLACDWEVCE